MGRCDTPAIALGNCGARLLIFIGHVSFTSMNLSKYQTPYETHRSKIITELIPSGERRSALDIGCGPGYYSSILLDKGWNVTAIDVDPKNIDAVKTIATETFLGDAHRILLEQPERKYDLVIALEIIEHLSKGDGEILLGDIRRVLKPEGVLLISTPNKFSPEGLVEHYYAEKIMGRRKWTAWDDTHRYIYSSCEIIKLLNLTKLSVTKTIGYWYNVWLPFVGQWGLPILASTRFPLNHLGFNVIIECHKI